MHLPDECWLKLINWIVNLAFGWMSGQQKVKSLEAELAECRRTAAWMGQLAAIGLCGLVLFIALASCKTYSRA